MKAKKITTIILDWMYIACVIYLLVYGIDNHITTGVPFNDSTIQWIMWLVWAVWIVHDPVKRIFRGYKEND